MPYYRHDPQSQYVVNFNWIKGKHNVRFGGDFYHMALNQAQAEFITGGFGAQGGFGFDRGITERCEAVDPATGNCEETSDGSRYNSVGGVPARSGQPRRQNAAGAGRVPRPGTALTALYARDRWSHRRQAHHRLRHALGVLPGSHATRSRHRTLRRRRPDKVLLCGVGSVPEDCGIETSKTRFAPAARAGLSHRRQVGRPRRLRTDQRSVLRAWS